MSRSFTNRCIPCMYSKITFMCLWHIFFWKINNAALIGLCLNFWKKSAQISKSQQRILISKLLRTAHFRTCSLALRSEAAAFTSPKHGTECWPALDFRTHTWKQRQGQLYGWRRVLVCPACQSTKLLSFICKWIWQGGSFSTPSAGFHFLPE